MRSLKNAILWSVTSVMVGVFFLAISALDSDSWYPFALFLMSGAYLALFCNANGFLYMDCDERGEDDDVYDD